MSTITVSGMLVRALVAAAERAGVDRAQFSARAGLRIPLTNILARIPLDEYERIVGVAYELTADPAFGLHLGERMTLGSFDVLGYLTEHSASLRAAIQIVLRYSAFVSDGPRLVFEEQADAAAFKVILPENESLAALLAAEFSMVTILRLFRSFVGEAVLPTRVCFIHERPAHAAEYARLFAGRECFSQAFTGLEFPRSWLEHTSACRESGLLQHLLQRAELLLSKAERNVPITERVRRWLAAQPNLSRPTLESVSRDLGLSSRTLRRQLQDEQTHFSTLVDDSRAVHAKRTLADEAQSIQETAYALGFRTPSAFSRAFKRWTGMTPRDYRGAR